MAAAARIFVVTFCVALILITPKSEAFVSDGCITHPRCNNVQPSSSLGLELPRFDYSRRRRRRRQPDTEARSKIFLLRAKPRKISGGSGSGSAGFGNGKGPSSSPPKGRARIPNEFSRPVAAEVVTGVLRRGQTYRITVEADEEERTALATRFRLPSVGKLEGQVELKAATSDSKASAATVDEVLVEGWVRSRLVQTCVRTNDDFEVDLEFDFASLVRSSSSSSSSNSNRATDVKALPPSSKSKAKPKRNKTPSGGGGGGGVKDMGLMELQRLLMDFDFEDDIVEDDSIFCDGVLDVGELVAQNFRLKIDPYPKKPGTEPVRFSITG